MVAPLEGNLYRWLRRMAVQTLWAESRSWSFAPTGGVRPTRPMTSRIVLMAQSLFSGCAVRVELAGIQDLDIRS